MDKVFAVIASIFIPGLGSIIRGGEKKSKRGLASLLGFFFCIPIALYCSIIIGNINLISNAFGFLIPLLAVLWIFGIVESVTA